MRRRDEAQLDPEYAAHADCAFGPDAAPHELDQPLGHHQPDARAFLATGLFAQAVEGLEQLLDLLRRQPGPGVAHADADGIFRALRASHRNRATRLVVLDGVEQQVDQHLLDAGPVGIDVGCRVNTREGHADAALLRLRLYHGAALQHDLGQGDRLVRQ